MKNPIFVALDVPDLERALRLAEQVREHVGGFKVGSELFTAAGPEIVRRLRGMGADVFLDLKFHDIPNTVAKAVASAVRLDAQMLTIHTAGGSEMMAAAEKAAQESALQSGRNAPLVLGVTVLTSMENKDLAEIGVEPNAARQVERLATLAVKSGLRGLVCSPLEVATLRQIIPSHMSLVTPGIRAAGARSDDQKRTLSAAEALAAGANYLVIGRPIYAAADPAAAAREIASSLRV